MDVEATRTRTLEIAQAFLPLAAQKRWDEWIDLWAEDGIMEFPYAPAGRKNIHQGRSAILAHIQNVAGRIKVEGLVDFRLNPMLDPTLAIIEYGVKGSVEKTGEPYHQRYIALFETRDGELARYREYWNPLVSIDAHGGREAWTAGFSPLEGDAA